MLQCNGAQSARRGCGTDRLAAYTNFAANSGKQVVTVAVAQYGLLRNNCSAFIYEEIFAQLHKSEKYVYVLDHFIHSNEIFAGHESGLVRKKVRFLHYLCSLRSFRILSRGLHNTFFIIITAYLSGRYCSTLTPSSTYACIFLKCYIH